MINEFKEERKIKKAEDLDLYCYKSVEVEKIKDSFGVFIKENNIDSFKQNYLKKISSNFN